MPNATRPGGGAYGDGDLDDERYWAAAELFITTGKPHYKDDLVAFALSRAKAEARRSPSATSGGTTWRRSAKMSLLTAPNALGEAALAEQRQEILGRRRSPAGAHRQARIPRADGLGARYVWGSNSGVLNAAILLGFAYDLTKDAKYAAGAADCMDYILGRNPLAFSYVSGYGTYALRNPHHRVWAHHQGSRPCPRRRRARSPAVPTRRCRTPTSVGWGWAAARPRPATSTTPTRTRPTRWPSTGTRRSPGRPRFWTTSAPAAADASAAPRAG